MVSTARIILSPFALDLLRTRSYYSADGNPTTRRRPATLTPDSIDYDGNILKFSSPSDNTPIPDRKEELK